MKLKFCGAARMVTGSCHMIECAFGTVLVDCGMRQGADAKTEYGEGDFPFEPKKISALLLTHAHIDHAGLIPLLVKRGFNGPIICTGATAKLSTIMLPDSGHIQEQEAEYTNRKHLRAGKAPVEPLYTVDDAIRCMKQFKPVEYGASVSVIPGVTARFYDVGHLLGSAAIEVVIDENGKSTKLIFSGDVGRVDRPIIRDPETLSGGDYLVMEGTYGDRNHDASTDAEKEAELESVLRAAIARGGNIVFPAFAVGRTQELLYYIRRMLAKNALPGLEKIPVYIDSPLGIEATRIYEESSKGYYDEEAAALSQDGSPFDFPTLRVARTADESKAINSMPGRNIIISSSGMCDAGRIRHHLKHNLYRADSTVIFMGYQAVGTLGRMLVDGVKKVKLFGEDVRVNAGIVQVDGFSGHAGRDELIAWMEAMQEKPKTIFMVHGEEKALAALAAAMSERGYGVMIPRLGEEFDLKEGVCQVAPKPITESPVFDRQLDAGIRDQLNRVAALLDSASKVKSEDMRVKLSIMEKDVKSLADRWHDILAK